MITIIDYGMGNLGSVQNMLKKIGEKSLVTSSKEDVQKATKLFLPGVGAFDKAMENLVKLDLIEIIKDKTERDKTPILGICLGMQLLLDKSEEGKLNGLSLIEGESKKFDSKSLIVPHMGWNEVKEKKENKMFNNMDLDRRFYFVHSYAVSCNNEDDILTTTEYGQEFVSSFARDNIVGVQFHPEKSHRYGMTLFKNFIENY